MIVSYPKQVGYPTISDNDIDCRDSESIIVARLGLASERIDRPRVRETNRGPLKQTGRFVRGVLLVGSLYCLARSPRPSFCAIDLDADLVGVMVCSGTFAYNAQNGEKHADSLVHPLYDSHT